MKKYLFSILGLTSIAAVALLTSCKSDADSSGFEYMPDMYRSPAIEAYVDYGEIRGRENKDLKSKLTALTPPRNTIPYTAGKDSAEVKLMLPYFRKPNVAFRETHGLFGFDITTSDEYLAAVNDKNPYVLTARNSEEVLKKGKELFTAMCQHCHGEKGDGNGPMVTSGAYVGVPNYATLTNLSDGQIFYSIYYGKGMMGAHGSLLSKKEIWTLVHYVRQFQNKDYGKFDASGKPVAVMAAASDSTKMKP
jgi:mono/diheme cytochrome c family protein